MRHRPVCFRSSPQHLPDLLNEGLFPQLFTTTPFERSSTGRFETYSCKSASKGLLPSLVQHRELALAFVTHPARRAATMAGVSLYRTQAFNSIFADDSIDKDLSTYATLTRDSITCNCVIWNGGAVKGTGRISAIICMRFTCSLLDCGRLVVSSPQSRFWNSRRTLGATLYVLPKLACRDARRSRQAHLLQQRTYAG